MDKKTEGKILDNQGTWLTEDELFKGKTQDQIKALKFLNSIGSSAGCFKTEYLTYEAYREVLDRKIAESNRFEAALSHLGIDIDQVKEIEPICFQYYDIKSSLPRYTKYVKDIGNISSIYQVTWIFFGVEQVYVYSISFDTTSDSTLSTTEEYFYKDIVSFSTTNESAQINVLEEEVTGGCGSKEIKRHTSLKMVKTADFKIGIPGVPFRCAYNEGDGSVSTKVNAMKQKLREKKQS